MKRRLTLLFWMLLIVVILIGGRALNIWYYTAILDSDLPVWVKFLLI